MKKEAHLKKMRVEGIVESGSCSPRYFLGSADGEIEANSLIGSGVRVDYTGIIDCIRCGNRTKSSYGQGFCYPCFISAPEAEDCVLRPELCRAHLGEARDMVWAEKHCLTDHFVYLALSPELKVGITRHTQIPTRWIDQGAAEAIIIARTPNRYLAGMIETALKPHVSDKTNWRKMLTGEAPSLLDLKSERERLTSLLPLEYSIYIDRSSLPVLVEYPVTQYPEKCTQLNLDKNSSYEGVLTGIKGQYLMFEGGVVFNVRRHSGYRVEFEFM